MPIVLPEQSKQNNKLKVTRKKTEEAIDGQNYRRQEKCRITTQCNELANVWGDRRAISAGKFDERSDNR